MASENKKYLSSQQGSAELIQSATGGEAFSNADHLLALGEERRNGQKNWDEANKTTLKNLVRDLKGTDQRLIIRAKNTGAWLSVRGTTVSVTLWSNTGFWYFLCARYNVTPIHFQSHCDRCGTTFGVTHALSCSKGGLFIVSYNIICDKLLYLAQQAFTPASVHS